MKQLEEKRDDILKIASQHGAFNVRVFGSVVRKEETEASDIDQRSSAGSWTEFRSTDDFLVDYDSTKTSPWFPGGLLMDLQDLLGCKVDIVTEQGLSPLIRERVLNEAKPLWMQTDNWLSQSLSLVRLEFIYGARLDSVHASHTRYNTIKKWEIRNQLTMIGYSKN